jgi:hypothetical protein
MWKIFAFTTLGMIVLALSGYPQADLYPLTLLPPEQQKTVDPQTGAELTFLTTNAAEDANLYYEQRSWLADSSVILFTSARERGGLMGYLTQTGELVCIASPQGALGGATAARNRNSVFALRGPEIVELALDVQPPTDPGKEPSRVTASEHVIAVLGPNYQPTNTSLSESCDGKYLAVGAGARGGTDPDKYGYVILIEVETGNVRELCRVPGPDFGGHVMFSLTNPNLVSHGIGQGAYLRVLDVRTGNVVWRHEHHENEEFCTHHCWWANDTITFCGGFHLKPNEDFDVKVVDIHTGVIRIIGRGSWWPEGTPEQLARLNWWHASGHESGRWVAADNWHGDIGLFHGKTTRTYWLTKGHRTYGGGRHPEVGWDRRGEQVIFASHMLGNVDVCVATIPKEWQDAWDKQ